MPPKPEERARERIDSALADAGWAVQDRDAMNLAAARGVAVREFRMAPGHGFADYMLFVDGQAAGVIEAKPVGYTPSSVELQADQYAAGLPAGLDPPVNPLPFLYVSTGVETRFINGLDPDPKTRRISHLAHVHRPETLAEWLAAETLDAWVKRLRREGGGFYTTAGDTRPASLRARLRTLPPLEQDYLYPVQVEAVKNVERSLRSGLPRALVQMATGSGKTICAITAIYRLIRYAGARRVLFLVFAKDDSHAEDIVETVRDEFGRGNDCCQKITYKVTAAEPRDLIQAFRNSFEPRIAVTVDMISTGADIKPIEIVMFMRAVKSRVLFEQMKGRGVRVIDPGELHAVTPDARAKTHFVIVDCVGVSDLPLADTRPLERKKAVPFGTLLEHVAMGGAEPAMLSSLAGRLARLDRQCGPEDRRRIAEASDGPHLAAIGGAIVEALDPDRQMAEARSMFQTPAGDEPTEPQLRQAEAALLRQAAEPIATRPALRRLLQDIKRQLEQIIDDISVDELIEVGTNEEARRKAKSLVASFEQFIVDNRDEIDALQCFYAAPYARRLRFDDLKALADTIAAPPRAWTPEKLWRAYQTLDKDRVRGASAERLLADLVSLVRFATHEDAELAPFAEQVRTRFDHWLARQRTAGRQFTSDQVRWLEMIRDHVATSVEMSLADLDYAPFAEQGGRGRAVQVFGPELSALLNELNEVLAA